MFNIQVENNTAYATYDKVRISAIVLSNYSRVEITHNKNNYMLNGNFKTENINKSLKVFTTDVNVAINTGIKYWGKNLF